VEKPRGEWGGGISISGFAAKTLFRAPPATQAKPAIKGSVR